MKPLVKYLLVLLSLFTACKSVPGADPKLVVRENIQKALLAANTADLKKDTTHPVLDTLILVQVDTITNMKAAQYQKDALQEKATAFQTFYDNLDRDIKRQKEMIAKGYDRGGLDSSNANYQKAMETIHEKLGKWNARLDSCNKILNNPIPDTSMAGYYVHYVLKITRPPITSETDSEVRIVTKKFEVVDLYN